MVNCRHFEVAKALKDIPKGETFVLRLVEPLKAGFGEFHLRRRYLIVRQLVAVQFDHSSTAVQNTWSALILFPLVYASQQVEIHSLSKHANGFLTGAEFTVIAISDQRIRSMGSSVDQQNLTSYRVYFLQRSSTVDDAPCLQKVRGCFVLLGPLPADVLGSVAASRLTGSTQLS